MIKTRRLAIPLAVLVAACAVTGALAGTRAHAGSQAKPTLKVAGDPLFVPWQFRAADNKTWKGINVDIANELGRLLNVKFVFKAASFDTIIPGLLSKRFDLAMTSMLDNKRRQKQVDFVDYGKSGESFAVRADDQTEYHSPDDLCGVKLGTLRGTIDELVMPQQSKKCESDGKSAISISIFPDPTALVLSLLSKRVDVVTGESAYLKYTVKQQPKLRISGAPFFEGIVGITFPKGSPFLKPARAAVQKLMTSGKLAQIFAKWGARDLALSRATINAGK